MDTKKQENITDDQSNIQPEGLTDLPLADNQADEAKGGRAIVAVEYLIVH